MTELSLPDSFWAASAPPAIETGRLEGARRTDVAIVGAGYTGLSTAIELAGEASVTVLEAGEIGHGGSGRNNGLAIPTLSGPDPDAIVRAWGEETGERFVALLRDSASHVYDLIRTHKMEGAGEQTGWIQPVHSPGRMRVAESRVEQWARRGADVELLDADRTSELLGSPFWHGGWMANTGGTVQPLAYTRGLAKAAAGLGATIHTQSPVTSIKREGSVWLLKTPEGELRADKVVLATNAYTDEVAPDLRRSIVPVYSFQMSTRPLSDNIRKSVIPGRQAVSDTRGDLHFFRWTDDGRLVTGAALFFKHNPTGRLPQHVGDRVLRAFPQVGEVSFDYIWHGFIGATLDKLPHLHVLGPGFFAWIGCNGRGVALASAMGPVLAEMVRGADVKEMPIPVTEPKPIPAHGLATRLAPLEVLRRRFNDAREPA